MKTIPIRIRIEETPKCFAVEVHAYGELWHAKWAVRENHDGRKLPKRAPAKTERAQLRVIKATHPRASRYRLHPHEKLTDFTRDAIAYVQAFALDRAHIYGEVLAPTNHVQEFWTVAYISRLAKALREPTRKGNRLALLDWLTRNWVKLHLAQKDRHELTTAANVALTTSFKPDTVWQAAYRDLDLLSERNSGPKPRPFR